MASIALPMMILGTAVSAASSFASAGQARQQDRDRVAYQQAQLDAQAISVRNQQALLENQQAAAVEMIDRRERERQEEVKRLTSAARAQYAAAGIDPDAGSAAAVTRNLVVEAQQFRQDDLTEYQRRAYADSINFATLDANLTSIAQQRRALRPQRGFMLGAGLSAASSIGKTAFDIGRIG